MEKKYIGYYRVSTARQGESGLGLAAQQSIVKKFIGDNPLVAEYTEVVSGTRKGNGKRIELQKAIEHSKSIGATLLIAKIDRLARSVQFISDLLNSEVDFVAADLPQANKFTIHLMAALAEQEADMISSRVKSALAELKKKGVKLGSPQNLTDQAKRKGREVIIQNAQSNEANLKAKALIIAWRKEGMSFQKIADKLNALNFKPRYGKKFFSTQVMRLSFQKI